MEIVKKFRREVNVAFSRLCRRKTTVNYLGLKLRVPLIYGMGRGYLTTGEMWMSHCIELLTGLKQGAILDIGGNVGVFLVKLRVIDQHREYFGFEPNPVCNFYVQELIRLNSFKNSRFYPVAISNENSMRTLYARKLGEKRASMHKFMRENEKLGYSFEMVTVQGDEFIRRLPLSEISLIKIDVEGAEYEVIDGIRGVLKDYRPFVFCEVLNLNSDVGEFEERKRRIDAIINILHELGYDIVAFKTTGGVTVLSKADEFNQDYEDDYIFSPSELTEKILETRGILS